MAIKETVEKIADVSFGFLEMQTTAAFLKAWCLLEPGLCTGFVLGEMFSLRVGFDFA